MNKSSIFFTIVKTFNRVIMRNYFIFMTPRRFDRYREVLAQWLAEGKAYRCYCTKEELDQLRAEVLSRTQGNTIFLAHMVGNALTHQPPLGMFKGISTIRSGEHKGTIDLKLTGVVPIVDLARVYALAGGHAEVNTHDRLTAASAGGALSEQSAHDLRDALEFLAFTRIQHQTRQMAAGKAPDNFLNPDEVSNFERSQLKDAFQVVQSLQTVLEHRYQSARF